MPLISNYASRYQIYPQYFKELDFFYKYTNVFGKTKKNKYLSIKFMTSEELDEGRDVILENDDYIFMEILNSQTAKYYGPDYIAKNWGRKFRDGNLYFLINKKSKDNSIWIQIHNTSSIEIENFDEGTLTLSELLRNYSFIEKYIVPAGMSINYSTF